MCPSISTQPVHSYLAKLFIYTYLSIHFYLSVRLNVPTSITTSPSMSNYFTVHIYSTCWSVHIYSACLTISTQLVYMYLLVHPYLPNPFLYTFLSIHIYPTCPCPVYLYLSVQPYLITNLSTLTQPIRPYLPTHLSISIYAHHICSAHLSISNLSFHPYRNTCQFICLSIP